MSVRHHEISNAVQDYAKAIWSLAQRDDEAVSTSAIAERLDVSAASASAMVKRLESMGLVEREPYHGVKLTAAGEGVALEVRRDHRLLEVYLADRGIAPGERFEVIRREPFDGPLTIEFAPGEQHVLGGALTKAMRTVSL